MKNILKPWHVTQYVTNVIKILVLWNILEKNQAGKKLMNKGGENEKI